MITKEDLENSKSNFLVPNTPYIAAYQVDTLADAMKRHNLMVTVGGSSAPFYEAFEKKLPKIGAEIIATKYNSGSQRPLKLWWLNKQDSNDLDTGKLLSHNSWCNCCGTTIFKNPITAIYHMVIGRYTSAFMLVNNVTYKVVKSSFLNEFLTLDFSYEEDGKSFHIISLKGDEEIKIADMGFYNLVNSIPRISDPLLQCNNLLKHLGVNIKPLQELVFDETTDIRETDTFYYTRGIGGNHNVFGDGFIID